MVIKQKCDTCGEKFDEDLDGFLAVEVPDEKEHVMCADCSDRYWDEMEKG